MDWSIQDVARLSGATSRTLRHYGDLGLLPPSRIGSNGYRFYDEVSLVRLQRILMLRALGLGLPAIGDVLAQQRGEGEALQHPSTGSGRSNSDWPDRYGRSKTRLTR